MPKALFYGLILVCIFWTVIVGGVLFLTVMPEAECRPVDHVTDVCVFNGDDDD